MLKSARESGIMWLCDDFILLSCFPHSSAVRHRHKLCLGFHCYCTLLRVLHPTWRLHRAQGLHQPQLHILRRCGHRGHHAQSSGTVETVEAMWYINVGILCPHLSCLINTKSKMCVYIGKKMARYWPFVAHCRRQLWSFCDLCEYKITWAFKRVLLAQWFIFWLIPCHVSTGGSAQLRPAPGLPHLPLHHVCHLVSHDQQPQ